MPTNLVRRTDTDWGVYDESGEQVGWIRLTLIAGEWEVGYHVAEEFRNQGHATAAVQMMVQEAFKTGRVKRIRAVANLDNVASIRVLKKAGFVEYWRGKMLVNFDVVHD